MCSFFKGLKLLFKNKKRNYLSRPTPDTLMIEKRTFGYLFEMVRERIKTRYYFIPFLP